MARSTGDLKTGRQKKRPSGQEIMKRRTPDDLSLRPARFESDPKKAYTTEQLAEIGAITLKWNQIEAHIEFIASFIVFTKSPFWLRISTAKILSADSECLRNEMSSPFSPLSVLWTAFSSHDDDDHTSEVA